MRAVYKYQVAPDIYAAAGKDSPCEHCGLFAIIRAHPAHSRPAHAGLLQGHGQCSLLHRSSAPLEAWLTPLQGRRHLLN